MHPPDAGKFLDYYLRRYGRASIRGPAGIAVAQPIGITPCRHTIYISYYRADTARVRHGPQPAFFPAHFATSVSIADPEAIEGARAALGHARAAQRSIIIIARPLSLRHAHMPKLCAGCGRRQAETEISG